MLPRSKHSYLISRNLNEKQREFPAPPWAGVKLVRSAASHFFNCRDALLQFGTHVIGLAKPAHPFWGKTRCAGSISRPCEGADAHGHARHGSNRRPLLRWHFCCVRVLLVPRESRQRRARAELKFATGRFAGFPPETTAKPRATAPVVLHFLSKYGTACQFKPWIVKSPSGYPCVD